MTEQEAHGLVATMVQFYEQRAKDRCERERNCVKPVQPHSCPYQSRVNQNDEYRCTCCAKCEEECGKDL